MIPKGWSVAGFGNLLESSNQGINTTTEKVIYSDVGIPAIRSNNVDEGRFDLRDKKFVSREEFERFSDKFKPNVNDILYCNIGSNLGAACLNQHDEPFLITWNVFRAVPKKNVLYPQFGVLVLNFNRRDIRRFATESTMPFLSSKVLLKYLFLVPPLPEQRKIAKILSTWDKVIATTEKLIAASKQQKRALMQQLLTGKKRLVNPETGRVFEGEWEEVRFDEVTLSTQLGTTSRTLDAEDIETIPLLKMGNLTWGGFSFDKFETLPVTQVEEKLILSKGDFLFNTRNTPELVGKSAVWKDHSLRVTFDNNINKISFNESVDPYYLCFYLTFGEGKSKINSLPAGSTSVAAIYWKDLKNIKFKLPSIKEQQKIVQVLTAADQETEHLESKLAHFQQEKKALMQQLLTGKRRVKVDEEEVVVS